MPGCSSSRASCSVVLKPQSPHFDTNKGAGAAHLLGREVKELRQRALVGQARLGVAQLIEERVCARLHGGHALVCPRVPPRPVICLARAQAHTRPLATLPPCLRPAAQTPRAEVLALVAPHHLPAPACGIWGGFYEMHVACGMHKRNATPGVYWRILLSRSIASGVAFDLKTRAHGCALICSRTHTPPRMSAHVVPKAMSAPAPL